MTLDLKKNVRNRGSTIDDGMQDTFEKLLAESTNTYFQAYFDHDFGEINRLLQEQRSLRKTLTNELRNYADQSIVLYTKLVQTYNIFNKLIQNEEQKKGFCRKYIIGRKAI